MLAGYPDGDEWTGVCDDAVGLLDQVREDGIRTNAFPEGYLDHRRGKFAALPVGVSYGGGQKVGGK